MTDNAIDMAKLEKLAEVAVRVGLDLQKGQDLVITAPMAAAPLVRLITKHAYLAGGGLVNAFYSDEVTTLMRYKYAADDNFERGVIRAPQAGVVDKLSVKSIGAVISPGQSILEIVPDSDDLTVEAMVSPSDIDQIAEGHRAVLRFSGLNRQTTPEIDGVVTFVSPDRITDERGATYYRVTIGIAEDQIRALGNVRLRVGMPVETFIRTSNRTMLSFLTRPLADQARRAFRAD